MSPSPAAGRDPELTAIWQQYRSSAAERLEAIDAAAAALAAGRLRPEDRARAVAEAHRLAGSLGLFGVVRGSELAHECERSLAGAGRPGAAEAARLRRLVGAIRAELAAGEGPADEG